MITSRTQSTPSASRTRQLSRRSSFANDMRVFRSVVATITVGFGNSSEADVTPNAAPICGPRGRYTPMFDELTTKGLRPWPIFFCIIFPRRSIDLLPVLNKSRNGRIFRNSSKKIFWGPEKTRLVATLYLWKRWQLVILALCPWCARVHLVRPTSETA